jgi:sec-independent protein translocase protein TatB
MLGIGAEELLLVLIVALLVLGPERLPRVARDVGRVVGDLRRTSDEFREEFLQADKFLAAEKILEKQASTPAVVEPATTATAVTTPTDPNETTFDREMREAREKLAATREKPLN